MKTDEPCLLTSVAVAERGVVALHVNGRIKYTSALVGPNDLVKVTFESSELSPQQYPEHEKLKVVAEKSQACGEFLARLLETYTLGTYHRHSTACEDEDGRMACSSHEQELYPTSVNTSRLLAEFFKIDEAKLEEEKRAMLDELANGMKAP